MPSKRELLGSGPPSEGLQWSEFQWNRIFAFCGGVVLLVSYLWIDPFEYAPDWIAAMLSVVPVGFFLYAFTNQSWRTSSKISVGIAIGSGLGTYLDSAGIYLLP